MKIIALPLALALAISAATPLFAQDSNEGKNLANLAFDSLDTTGRGFIDIGEFQNFGSDVFVSMDYDDNQKINLEEFLSWDFGMRPIAIERGLENSYDTALKVVFAFWDRNGDQQISRTEHRRSLNRDFQRADLDGDATLSKAEFLGGFSVMVAIRAALVPTQ